MLSKDDTTVASYGNPPLQGHSFSCQRALLITGMTDSLSLSVKELEGHTSEELVRSVPVSFSLFSVQL